MIDRDAEHLWDDCDRVCKARLTTWLVNQRRLGNGRPKVTRDKIEAARKAKDMRVSKRADRILQFLADKTRKLGTHVEVELWSKACKTYLELLAHSESVGASQIGRKGDLQFLLEYLRDSGMIKIQHLHNREFGLTLTVLGFERVADLEHVANAASDRAFVAMWFDKSLNDASENGIERAIKNAGYKPVRVDKQEFTDRIDDRIISEIRRSRFVVADFSQGDDGARGGVYYEAGFAHGLGLKVIFTCRRDSIEKVHFDTRQYNHIVWEDVEDLRRQLEVRIMTVMGDGPRRGTESA